MYKGDWKSLPANIRLLSMREHPQGYFLRLCETWGQNASVSFPEKYMMADALENVSGGTESTPVRFQPFELKNIVLVKK
ncbi:MAG: hypothetical protein IKA79_02435 [Lentisphaeria bacterium]|nr:hypothetical protein [Lentisphaeria bacterium]